MIKELVKKYLWAFLIVAAAFVFSLVAYLHSQSYIDSPFWIAASALLTALLTGLLITITEKAGWISNYRSEMRTLEKKIEELPLSLNERLFFGFERIIPNFEEPNFLIDHENGEVCWLNTYFRYWDQKPETIFSVVQRGNKVKLLFLHPFSEAVNERAYYSFALNSGDGMDDHKNAYQSSLITNYRKCRTLLNDFRDRFPELDESYLQIRFYCDSPQLPLIVLRYKSEGDGTDDANTSFAPVRAASGFYLDQYSSQMPYITWRRTDDTGQILVENISNYFDKKWNNEKTITIERLAEEVDPPSSEESGTGLNETGSET